jgi:hypothetical protein
VSALPIIFHDGQGEWTAETNFLNKTRLCEIFGKYIPSFEYIMVNLNKVSREKLLSLKDPLSFILLADKVKGPEELGLLTELPEEYLSALEQNFPAHLKRLVADVVSGLLSHEGIDKELIAQISDQIEDRRPIDMFDGIVKGWGKDHRALVKAEKANAVLEQKYSSIERENALLKERLRQLEQNQPKQN